MTKKRALDAVLAAPWAILPGHLELIASIAEREHEYAGNLQALEAKLGRPLGNTMTASVRDGVAVIPVEGPMFKRAGLFAAMSGATDYVTIAQDLSAALEDPNVSAVMLQIDSPGGEVRGLSDLVSMIKSAGKPVWAHIDGTGASAAYWMASSAAKVWASDTTIVGSIGAMLGMTEKDPKPGEKSYRFVSSQSPLKNAGPATKEGADAIQAMVDDLGKLFVDAVAANRKVSADFVLENFGRGDVMVASKAAAAGMIDHVGTFEAALSDLKKEINTMDFKSLTAQALAENRPDLVAAIRTEALATVEMVDAQSIRAEAVAAERERIAGIEALAMPGAESIVAACKADGTEPSAAAIKILAHMRESTAGKAATALKNIQAAEATMTPPTSVEAKAGGAKGDAEAALHADIEAVRKTGIIR
jgi:ClpP class serine protease